MISIPCYAQALIRTHHITSRKKISKLSEAASKHGVYVLIRVGKPPGIMYVEGRIEGVKAWITCVHKLRYKDYHLAVRPAAMPEGIEHRARYGLHEVETTSDFAGAMQQRGFFQPWRVAMGYAGL